ncbi:MAG: YHYH protein [Chthoniobacteraceae bacterium]
MRFPISRLSALLLVCASAVHADPILTSWFTENSGVLARVIQSGTLTTPVTTWPAAGVTNNNTGGAAQTVPAYADVQRIRYTATDVYINASGFGSYTMGPWFNNAGGLFGFWPLARDYQVRITRNPAPAATKTRHPGGMIGMMVNGVAIYDLGDAFSFKQTANTPSVTGTDQMGANGDGWWSRDALAVEVVTFDPGFAHQPGNNGQYHYHAQPKALRHQLGDNVQATYNAATNTYTYTEDTSNLHHSPILGWAYDGYPIYGPYGYGTANDPNSTVRRMRTGFVLRNGQSGTQDLRVTGRVTMPKWAAAVFGIANPGNTNPVTLPATQYGPATTYQTTGPGGVTTYSLGRYCGDYDFLGDLGQVQGVGFDLDTYNGRTCVTPEFPGGTYAYFVTLDAVGNTEFPHMLGKQYYGTPNAGNAPTVPGDAVLLFNGGPNIVETWSGVPSANSANGNVTLTWNSVEGGTYKVEASPDLATWTTLDPALPAAANATQTAVTETGAYTPGPGAKRFYKVSRTSLAPYDPAYTGQ